jgi:hypothetical protein
LSGPSTGFAEYTEHDRGHGRMAAFRLAGWDNLKKARRAFSHGIHRCVDLITKPVKPDKDQT